MKEKQDCLLTIRLSASLQNRLTEAAEELQELKSAIARRSIALYLAYYEKEQKPLLTSPAKQVEYAEQLFESIITCEREK